MLDTLAASVRDANRVVKYHLKLDTGMGRLGILPEQLSEFLARAITFPEIELDGLMTHLASADEPDKSQFTDQQIARFQHCLKITQSHGFHPRFLHISNSAGAHAWPQARNNLARVGGLLYGFTDTIATAPPPPTIAPALSLHSRIILLKRVAAGTPLGYGGSFQTDRESIIATLPIGYDDGLRRAYSNNGRVIVRGAYAPLVGRVSMDLTLVDVTDIPGAALGDEVILIGQSGNLAITAEEMGARIGTISYEVTCALTGRVPRFHLDADSPRPQC
jgi:alanine racemase